MLHNMDEQVAVCERYIKAKEDIATHHKQLIQRLQARIDQTPVLDPRLEPFRKLLEIDTDYLLKHTEEVFSMLIGFLADHSYSQQFIAQKINAINDIRIALSEVVQLSKPEVLL